MMCPKRHFLPVHMLVNYDRLISNKYRFFSHREAYFFRDWPDLIYILWNCMSRCCTPNATSVTAQIPTLWP